MEREKRAKQIKKGQLTLKEEKQTLRKKKCSDKCDKDGAVASLGLLWIKDYMRHHKSLYLACECLCFTIMKTTSTHSKKIITTF